MHLFRLTYGLGGGGTRAYLRSTAAHSVVAGGPVGGVPGSFLLLVGRSVGGPQGRCLLRPKCRRGAKATRTLMHRRGLCVFDVMAVSLFVC